MKTYLILFLSIALFASCDILEPEPQASLDSNTALTNGGAAEAITLGMYSSMQSIDYYGLEYLLNSDLVADNAVYQGFFDSQLEIDSKQVPFSNLWVGNGWVAMYRVINIANQLIAEVPTLDDPTFSSRDRVLGEAYAVRALVYFDLLRYYGEHYNQSSAFGMPLLLEPINTSDFASVIMARSSVADTYAQVLSDLNEAIPLLDGFSDQGRMNYWAAIALRARVNLYRQDYAAAFADADNVIQNSGLSLLTDVADIYGPETTNESIFEVEFNSQDASSYNTYLIRRDEYNVDPSLVAAIEAGDARADFFGTQRNALRCFKYPDATNANNAKVLRLAEMYFIRAEAAVFANSDLVAGAADLNVIRNRAGLGDVGPFATQAEFIDALLQERRIELSYEGHRFFDLVRFDRTNSVLGITEDFRKIFPIPRNELLVDEQGILAQNPGYETL